MSQPDSPQSRYGRERVCPQCGTRVALKAKDCFFCGASLDDVPRHRATIPWPDIALFLVIGGLVAFWWLRAPINPVSQQMAAVRSTDAAPAVTPTPQPTSTPLPLTATPSPSSTFTPTRTPASTPSRYKVEPGDSLELIAERLGSTSKDIIEANGLTINSMLHPGDELIVPVKGPSGGPGATATPSGGALVYAVQPGDTIESIAATFKSQTDWILGANKLQATDLLRIGQSLLIPLTPGTPAPVLPTPTRVLPTFTPASGYRAPALLLPSDGASVAQNTEVLLTWTSVGVLAGDEWYVVTLVGGENAPPIAPYWTKTTTWRLSSENRPAGVVKFTWQVQVLSGTPGKPGTPHSPASTPRTFRWQ